MIFVRFTIVDWFIYLVLLFLFSINEKYRTAK
jgi:hypothetical protein